MQLCGSLNILWHWNENWLFQSCGQCWVFQICWHSECSTLIESFSRTWNSSAGIPSPPLALFVVMLPKAHLTSHSRMTGSRWVTTPLWLCRSHHTIVVIQVTNGADCDSDHELLLQNSDLKWRKYGLVVFPTALVLCILLWNCKMFETCLLNSPERPLEGGLILFLFLKSKMSRVF